MAAPLPPAGPLKGFRATPLLAWVLVQMVGLAIAAAGLPLWARHPFPRTSLAFEIVLVTQVAGISLLFPIVFSDALPSLAAVALTCPFLQLAALLASTPQGTVLTAGIYVWVWMAGLAALSLQLASARHQLIAVALTAGISIGGVVLQYVRAEATAAGQVTQLWPPLSDLSPTMAALGLLRRVGVGPVACCSALAPFAAAAIIRAVVRPKRPSPSHSTSLHY